MFAVPEPLMFGNMSLATPRTHRRHSLVDPSSLMRAPVKKDRRPSLTQIALDCLCKQPKSSPYQSQSDKCSRCLRHIRKRLDFCVSTETSSRKRANSLFSALHSDKDAVPLSDLDITSRKRVRFAFTEMLDEAPETPETPIFEPRIYKSAAVQEQATPTGSTTTGIFTKLSNSIPAFAKGRSLFNNDASSEVSTGIQRPTARNLKLFMA